MSETTSAGGDLQGLVIETLGLDDGTRERFSAAAASSARVFAGVAREYGVELPELRIIGTFDFQGTVNEVLREKHGNGEPAYTTERLGGTAVGKTILLSDDHTRAAIVMSAHGWTPAAEEAGLGLGLFLLAHELTHAVLERVREVSGALDGVTFPSVTPVAVARSITRIAVDEVRADKVADVVLSLNATKTVDGAQAPLHITDAPLLGPVLYRDRLAELLTTTVYPGWRDLVNRYRNWGCSLDELMRELFQQTDQVMTAFGHAEGERQCTPENPEMYLAPAKDAPGAAWLIGPVWEAIMEVAEQYPFLPSAAEFKAAELAILDAGERELFAMWDRLGVTFDPPRPPSHPFEVKVREPAEPPPTG